MLILRRVAVHCSDRHAFRVLNPYFCVPIFPRIPRSRRVHGGGAIHGVPSFPSLRIRINSRSPSITRFDFAFRARTWLIMEWVTPICLEASVRVIPRRSSVTRIANGERGRRCDLPFMLDNLYIQLTIVKRKLARKPKYLDGIELDTLTRIV